MKTFTIDPNGWTYKLLVKTSVKYSSHQKFWAMSPEDRERRSYYGLYAPEVARDFCAYWRAVSWRLLGFAFAVFLAYLAARMWFHLPDFGRKEETLFQALFMVLGIVGNCAILGSLIAISIMKWGHYVASFFGYIFEWFEERKELRDANKPQKEYVEKSHPIRDTLQLAYQSYKHKYCPMASYGNEIPAELEKDNEDDSSTESDL